METKTAGTSTSCAFGVKKLNNLCFNILEKILEINQRKITTLEIQSPCILSVSQYAVIVSSYNVSSEDDFILLQPYFTMLSFIQLPI